jgi:hypothetical protein
MLYGLLRQSLRSFLAMTEEAWIATSLKLLAMTEKRWFAMTQRDAMTEKAGVLPRLQ